MKTYQTQSLRKETTSLINQSEFHLNKPKTKRDKGCKYFKKVAYTKERMKSIPRWCSDMELLDKMVIL